MLYTRTSNSLRHSAGPLTVGLQDQIRGCVKLVGVKGRFDPGDDDGNDHNGDDAATLRRRRRRMTGARMMR